MRTLTIIAVLGLLAGAATAQDPFVGKWKLNQSKSKLAGEQEKIEDLGGNKYKFTFGDNSETLVIDGTDQPLHFSAGTWSVKQQGPDTWKEVRKHDGKVTSESTWTLSDGGKRLSIATNGTRPDGSAFSNEMDARRIGEGTGLAGTWQSTKLSLSQPAEWDIQPYEGDGLSFNFPAEKDTLNMKFDGKEYTEQGPNVAPDSTSSGRRINSRTLEITDKVKGREMDKTMFKVSPDGKTLTLTVHNAGEKNPQTIVYDRIAEGTTP
ncbi:MAG: hypothetical protein JO270_21940 [Acidobacteriaceae bacterium]|nr:hypothetical protein [Acidobacteriaceae bacterium]MBV8570121.1 hypothetical protein [Acidobacteriaceae bacterium]